MIKKFHSSNFLKTVFFMRCCSSFKRLPVVTLYSKAENCSLCDEAKMSLKKFDGIFVLEEVDITAAGNETWYEKYKYEIPVVHLNGTEIMRHKVFEKEQSSMMLMNSDSSMM